MTLLVYIFRAKKKNRSTRLRRLSMFPYSKSRTHTADESLGSWFVSTPGQSYPPATRIWFSERWLSDLRTSVCFVPLFSPSSWTGFWQNYLQHFFLYDLIICLTQTLPSPFSQLQARLMSCAFFLSSPFQDQSHKHECLEAERVRGRTDWVNTYVKD